VEAADTLVALAEAYIGPAVAAHIEVALVAEDRLPLAEAHIVPALVLAAGRLAGRYDRRDGLRVTRNCQGGSAFLTKFLVRKGRVPQEGQNILILLS